MRCPKCITVNIPESPVTRLAGGASCMDSIHSSSPCHAPADMCAVYDNLHSEVPLSLLKATIMLTFFHIDAFFAVYNLVFCPHISRFSHHVNTAPEFKL